MGLELTNWDYGDDCPNYSFGNGTPKYLMCSFTGIATGDWWTDPPGIPCPNRIFKLTQLIDDACSWVFSDADYIITYKIAPDHTELNGLAIAIATEFFTKTIFDHGIYFFENAIALPAHQHFFGGKCQIAWIAPSPSPSLRDAVTAMGYDPDGPIKVDFWPSDEDHMLVRVVNEEDHTTYYAKYKFTPLIIFLWSGTIANIPDGYVICDGNNGTPDLRNDFVVGTGDTYLVDDTGGDTVHTHRFSADGHNHNLAANANIAPGTDFSATTNTIAVKGKTEKSDSLPPYYALAYIMKP